MTHKKILCRFIENVRENRIHYICLSMIFAMIAVFAWQCDDAYHAHRMSWNLLNGNGFVYNAGERVSATTAPLFTLLNTLVYAIVGDIYWSTLLFCMVCSMVAIYIMQRRFARKVELFSTCLLIFCTSFISYTTSGLENPLLFLLAGGIIIQFFNHDKFGSKQLLYLSFLSSLLITTRMDNALIVLPLLIYSFFIKSESKPKAILCGFAGMLPFIIWIAFSVIYYGFPYPNTAYAKLNTGFPLTDYLFRGIRYFIVTGYRDPLVIALPSAYMIYSIIRKNTKHIMIASGIALYYCYIVYIGGCFMMGRHFTVPFFIAAFCIFDLLPLESVELWKMRKKIYIVKSAAVILFASLLLQWFLNVNNPYNRYLIRGTGADERALYFLHTSIPLGYLQSKTLNVPRGEAMCLSHWEEHTGLTKELLQSGAKGDIFYFMPGLVAYYYAQTLYVNDEHALGDPLLARIPANHVKDWYIGHMRRTIPSGYRESIQTGENMITDPALREYYDILRLITRSENLFAPERLRAIIAINIGKYDYLIDAYLASENK